MKRDERNRQLLESIAEAIDESEEHAYGEVFHELCGDELASVLDPQVSRQRFRRLMDVSRPSSSLLFQHFWPRTWSK